MSLQKATQWVLSSFDGFGDVPADNVQKSRSQSQKSRSNSDTAKTSGTRSLSQKSGINSDTAKPTGNNHKAEAAGIKRTFESLKREEKGDNGGLFSRKTVSRRANKLPETDLWSDKYTPKLQVL